MKGSVVHRRARPEARQSKAVGIKKRWVISSHPNLEHSPAAVRADVRVCVPVFVQVGLHCQANDSGEEGRG